MTDQYGRKIKYLRLSVTDLCSCRCVYCMGAEGVPKLPHEAVLSFEEIEEIVRAAVSLGVRKVRLTGGEPLVRRGIDELVRRLRAIEGIRELAMTTNGARLAEYAERLKSAGLDRLNVSLDTLDPEKYRKITRIGSLSDTLAGLDAARSAGFTRIKLNAVLMGGVNDDEIPALAELARDGAFDVRFIELMPIGECADWDRKRFIPAERVLEVLPKAQRVHRTALRSCGVRRAGRARSVSSGRSVTASARTATASALPRTECSSRVCTPRAKSRCAESTAKRSSAPSRRASAASRRSITSRTAARATACAA